MNSITTFALRHRLLVVLIWLGLALAGAATVSSTTGRLTHSFATPGRPGYDANQHIDQRLGIDSGQDPTIAVLQLPAGQTMKTAAGRATAAHVFAAATAVGHNAVADYAGTHDPKLVSRDARTTWAVINLPNPDAAATSAVASRSEAAMKAALPAGATLSLTGYEHLQSGGGGSGPSVLVETLIGIAGALVVLAFVFGSAIAVVPLMMAIVAILVSFLGVLGVTQFMDVSFIVEFLVALIGLGVAVDYSLLVVTRWREEREAGKTNEQAILAAAATAGHAVVFSGLTVAIGLLSLIVLPVPFLRSIGLGGMLIPLVAVAAAVTLLPITLSAVGPALDRARVRRRGATTSSRGWERWGRLIVRYPWFAGIAGLAIILALAAPALLMNTGQPKTTAVHSGPAHSTLQYLEGQGVPSGIVYPIQLLSHGGAAGAARAAEIARATPGVYDVLAPSNRSFRAGGESLITVIPNAEGNTAAGTATVHALQRALPPLPGGVEVGGTTAQNLDFNHAVYGNFPLMLGLIALVTFAILARAFRSVILAFKAVVLNVISLGAAYGFLVLFWQQGHGSHLIYGFPPAGAIRNFVPIIVFAFLFGLSMDYEVFVLARTREEYDRLGDTEEAIVSALSRTGRLVTSASIILAISFLSIGLNPELVIKMIATGLAVGIVIDAVVIRTLLVPALITLLGRWNWWMPHRLARALRA